MRIEEEIAKLKKEKNAIILAHYYQTGDIQDIADIVGDSYALSRQARDSEAGMIVFCGVKFMAESAKILSPDKTVLLPAPDAGCPMADMVTPEDVLSLRKKYPDAAVVTYVNSSAEVKALSDICVTSSNAVKIVRGLAENRVIFVPDQNLASYVAAQVPEKEIIPFSGYCIVHHRLTAEDADRALAAVPGAKLLVHPECPPGVVKKADFVGSTAGIIAEARRLPDKKIIIGTETGVLHVLKRENPDKEFFLLSTGLICSNMKKTKMDDVLDALKYDRYKIILNADIIERAKKSLDRMLEAS
jgi:quinolinate synthase